MRREEERGMKNYLRSLNLKRNREAWESKLYD